MNKPPFNPSQPFEPVNQKPAFDPNAPFESAEQASPTQSGGSTVMRTLKTLHDYSPTQMMIKPVKFAADAIQSGFNKMGEAATEAMGRKQVNPHLSAGIGTAISMAPDIAMSIGGPKTAPPSILNKTPNLLQRAAGKEINRIGGIKPSTISHMAGKENPAEYGAKLARSFADEGAFGMSPGAMFNRSKKVLGKFGQKVGDTLKALKESGVSTDAKADDVLNPLVDEWVSLRDSGLSANISAAKPIETVYGKLVERSTQNGGRIGLDDLGEQMKEVGKALERAGEGTPLETAYQKLYGKLAQARNKLVERIAQESGNPALADDLLAANEGYTRYSRVMPDISQAAARSSVGKAGIHPVEWVKGAVGTPAAKLMMGLGTSAQKTRPSMFGRGGGLAGYVAANKLEEEEPTVVPNGANEYYDVPGADGVTPFEASKLRKEQIEDSPNSAKKNDAQNDSASDDEQDTSKPVTVLTEKEAKKYLKKAKGNRELARKMAIADGWTIPL